MTHLSLLCKLQQGQDHRPCSGTCDCSETCQLTPGSCECECHGDPNALREWLAGERP